MFGLLAFVPAWFDRRLGAGAGAGNAAVAAMLAAGALGTYLGARAGDRVGHPRVAIVSLALAVPLGVLVVPAGHAGWPLAAGLLVVVGIVMDANFYPLVLVAQDALPGRVGLASGVTIGLSVGIGAGIVALLGLLADARGTEAALYASAGLALAALASALPLSRGRASPRAGAA
jgi:FSR family fosmidomycin resistance protein-like MFS transporter